MSAGGVGRNIGDAISKLGHEVLLISAVGKRDIGAQNYNQTILNANLDMVSNQ